MENIIKFKNESYIKILSDKTQCKSRGQRAKLHLHPNDTVPSDIVSNILEGSVNMSKQIVCNKCGKPFDIWDKQENFQIYRNLGYGTKYDGSKLDLNLCCNCMEELVDGCWINPIIDIEK